MKNDEPTIARYDVLTWDPETQCYTEQEGTTGRNVTWAGVLRALRELRLLGYSCHRVWASAGDYDSDPAVLVERI